MHLSFVARRGDKVDITGISETLEGTREHTAFACTKVTVNVCPQNIKEQH